MAFNVAYGSVISRNINHLYTTRQKTMYKVSPRVAKYNPDFLELERQAKERHQRRRRTRRRPNVEFIPEFDIEIPKAPAFRVADSDYVDAMVNRLSQKSKVKTNPRGCDHYHRGFRNDYEWESDIVSPREKPSRRKVNEITSRLHRPLECTRRHPSPDLREEDYLPNIQI